MKCKSKETDPSFIFHLGIIILHLECWRQFLEFLLIAFDNKIFVLISSSVVGFLANLTTTFSIHPKDSPKWAQGLSLGFPNFWAFRSIIRTEFQSIDVLRCSTNPVITENSIIKQVPCGLPDGQGVIKYFELNEDSTSGLPLSDSILSLCIMYFVLKMLNVLGSILFQTHRK